MSGESNSYKEALKTIANSLDNIKYECESRIYTLEEDEMATVFFCRDLAQNVLRENNDAK